jgi:hypothetical protein
MRSREERIASNEALCRELNERKAEWMKNGLPTAGFRCECAELGCGSRFQLSGGEWAEARSRPNRFAVAPGHVVAEVETVVKRHPNFWLVEKDGRAGEVAEKRS